MKLGLSEAELIDWVSKIVTEFYVLIYDDPWFSKIFRNIEQDIITSQQTDFMIQCFGGPAKFCGRIPKDAHPQVWVDEDIWKYREELLVKAFDKLQAPKNLRDKWIKIDEAFKNVIINKAGPEECFGRFKTEEIIFEPMPEHLKKKTA